MKFPIPGLGLAGVLLNFWLNQKKSAPSTGAGSAASVVDLTAITKFLEETKRQLGPVAGQGDEQHFFREILGKIETLQQYETFMLSINDPNCMNEFEAENLIANLAHASARNDDVEKVVKAFLNALEFCSPDHIKFAGVMRSVGMLKPINTDSELMKLIKEFTLHDFASYFDRVLGDPAKRGDRMSAREKRIANLNKKLGR
jgi:hypothetical protein